MLATSLLVTPQWALQQADLKPIDPETIIVLACDEDPKSKECMVGLIKKYSKVYNYPVNMAMDVADCESDFKHNAVGDRGKAYGIYQFHKPTFQLLSKRYGSKPDGSKWEYKNTEDNIRLAIWALSSDRGFHWTCYRRIASR